MEDVPLDELRAQFNQEIQTLTMYVFAHVLKPTFCYYCVQSAKVQLYGCNLYIDIGAFVMSDESSIFQQFFKIPTFQVGVI